MKRRRLVMNPALAQALARHPATLHQQVPALADVVDLAEWKARKGEK